MASLIAAYTGKDAPAPIMLPDRYFRPSHEHIVVALRGYGETFAVYSELHGFLGFCFREDIPAGRYPECECPAPCCREDV